MWHFTATGKAGAYESPENRVFCLKNELVDTPRYTEIHRETTLACVGHRPTIAPEVLDQEVAGSNPVTPT
jgi:hypothetical protein